MMVEKNTITQEELDKMNLHGVVDPTSDVCNGIILIRNELNVLESCIKYYAAFTRFLFALLSASFAALCSYIISVAKASFVMTFCFVG